MSICHNKSYFVFKQTFLLLQISQLTEENQRLKACMTEIQETSMSQINRLKDQLEQNRQLIMRLESRLDSQKDYEDLKREIRYCKF